MTALAPTKAVLFGINDVLGIKEYGRLVGGEVFDVIDHPPLVLTGSFSPEDTVTQRQPMNLLALTENNFAAFPSQASCAATIRTISGTCNRPVFATSWAKLTSRRLWK